MRRELFNNEILVELEEWDVGSGIYRKEENGIETESRFLTAEEQEFVEKEEAVERLEQAAKDAITRLRQIEAASSPTNAQVISAIQDMAQIQRRIITRFILPDLLEDKDARE